MNSNWASSPVLLWPSMVKHMVEQLPVQVRYVFDKNYIDSWDFLAVPPPQAEDSIAARGYRIHGRRVLANLIINIPYFQNQIPEKCTAPWRLIGKPNPWLPENDKSDIYDSRRDDKKTGGYF